MQEEADATAIMQHNAAAEAYWTAAAARLQSVNAAESTAPVRHTSCHSAPAVLPQCSSCTAVCDDREGPGCHVGREVVPHAAFRTCSSAQQAVSWAGGGRSAGGGLGGGKGAAGSPRTAARSGRLPGSRLPPCILPALAPPLPSGLPAGHVVNGTPQSISISLKHCGRNRSDGLDTIDSVKT